MMQMSQELDNRRSLVARHVEVDRARVAVFVQVCRDKRVEGILRTVSGKRGAKL